MKGSQQFLIKPTCLGIGLGRPSHSRSVLASNFDKPKTSAMTKSVELVLGSSLGLGLPLKSTISTVPKPRPSRPTFSEETIVGLHANRKRRLDYLTFEEKLKRKKLKNRVAAQTSRDRKKARMDELEAEVKELQEKNTLLVQANFNLQMEKETLTVENQDLREKLSNQRIIASQQQAVGVGCSPLIVGPAVSVVDPLPQGRGLHPAPGLCEERALWKILTFCILSQISLQTLKNQTPLSANLKNLQQVCFEKLVKTNKKSLHKWMTRLLADVENGSVPVKWWGRQQKTWNPVED